jgi:hypothetical protein
MRQSVPKIVNVKMKNGGAPVELLGRSSGEIAVRVRNSLGVSYQHALNEMEDLAGYVLVAWDHRGANMCMWRVSMHSPIPDRLIPSFVHDLAADEVIVRDKVLAELEDHGF